jgi:hypothetical protein
MIFRYKNIREHTKLRAKQNPIIGPVDFSVRVNVSDSRQVRRRKLRLEAFKSMTDMYSGESRKVRRSMAFDAIRNAAKVQ